MKVKFVKHWNCACFVFLSFIVLNDVWYDQIRLVTLVDLILAPLNLYAFIMSSKAEKELIES